MNKFRLKSIFNTVHSFMVNTEPNFLNRKYFFDFKEYIKLILSKKKGTSIVLRDIRVKSLKNPYKKKLDKNKKKLYDQMQMSK